MRNKKLAAWSCNCWGFSLSPISSSGNWLYVFVPMLHASPKSTGVYVWISWSDQQQNDHSVRTFIQLPRVRNHFRKSCVHLRKSLSPLGDLHWDCGTPVDLQFICPSRSCHQACKKSWIMSNIWTQGSEVPHALPHAHFNIWAKKTTKHEGTRIVVTYFVELYWPACAWTQKPLFSSNLCHKHLKTGFF